jgi:hypothetical protein
MQDETASPLLFFTKPLPDFLCICTQASYPWAIQQVKESTMYTKSIILVLLVLSVFTFTVTAQPLEEVQPAAVVETASPDNGLLYMREEEKLARDVYLALYEIWGARTFLNIAQAEQQHMDTVGALLASRNLEDPAAQTTFGEFKNPDLADLYTQLVEKGSVSLVQAYQVGALIEDLDIADLQSYLAQTEDEAEIWVYTALLRGSQNHMRSFVKQLSRYNESYQPVYITEAELAALLSTR